MSPEASPEVPEDVLIPLRAAGWFPGRVVPVEHWTSELERQGFHTFSSAREFLESFGGLTFTAPKGTQRAFNPGSTRLDPVLAASGEFDRIQDWEVKHNLSFFPVGNVFNEYYMLLITPDRSFYAGSYDDDLAFLARGPEDAFRQLLYAPTELIFLQRGS